jgi:uncharacterized protein (TIGR02996 family)
MYSTVDVTPVLKSLHADPTTHLVFADWFDEHGDSKTADRLRSGPVCDRLLPGREKRAPYQLGEWLLDQVCHPQRFYTPNPVLARALTEEAFSRFTITEGDHDHFAREVRVRCEKLRGTRTSQWRRFPAEWGRRGFIRVAETAAKYRTGGVQVLVESPDLFCELPVRSYWLNWEGGHVRTHALCGGWLSCRAAFFVGRARSGEFWVSELSRDCLSEPQLHTIPF